MSEVTTLDLRCPHKDCPGWERCHLIDSVAKYEYAKNTRFRCRDCSRVSCFYCGDLIRQLCEDCKEKRLA